MTRKPIISRPSIALRQGVIALHAMMEAQHDGMIMRAGDDIRRHAARYDTGGNDDAEQCQQLGSTIARRVFRHCLYRVLVIADDRQARGADAGRQLLGHRRAAGMPPLSPTARHQIEIRDGLVTRQPARCEIQNYHGQEAAARHSRDIECRCAQRSPIRRTRSRYAHQPRRHALECRYRIILFPRRRIAAPTRSRLRCRDCPIVVSITSPSSRRHARPKRRRSEYRSLLKSARGAAIAWRPPTFAYGRCRRRRTDGRAFSRY